MRFTFVTLFPELLKGYFEASILGRAIERGSFAVDFCNPRAFTEDKFNRVDAPMVSGGAGMLMTPQPLYDTLQHILDEDPEAHIVFPLPVGKPFVQNDAKRHAKQYRHIVYVCGRYEGIDERVIERFADECLSIGDYVLTGGELAAAVMCDATARHIEGVLGNSDSLHEESFESTLLEAPAFTKPVTFRGSAVVSEFLKGNHSKISDLKKQMALCKTQYFRPEIIKKAEA